MTVGEKKKNKCRHAFLSPRITKEADRDIPLGLSIFAINALMYLGCSAPRRHIVLNYLGFREVVVAAPFLPSKLRGLSTLGRPQLLRKHVCLRVVTESLPVMSLYASFNAFKEPLLNFKASAGPSVVVSVLSAQKRAFKRKETPTCTLKGASF